MLHRIFALSFVLLFSISCGGSGGGSGGGDDGDDTERGVFIDAPTEGVLVRTATQEDLTDDRGRFPYLPGEIASFYIGDILLGMAPAADQVTPLDFVPGAADENDAHVTNILRFVQSLDADRDPDNGIRILRAVRERAVGQAVNFDQSVAAFEAAIGPVLSLLTDGAVNALVDADAAREHFRESLDGGGGGDPGNGFGSLDFSGPDVAGEVNSTYVPTLAVPLLAEGSGAVSWGSVPGVSGTATIVEGQITQFIYIEVSTENIENVYSYLVNCTLHPVNCLDIEADLDDKTLTFRDATIPIAQGGANNIATGALGADGTLRWD